MDKFSDVCVDPHLGLLFVQPNFAKCHDLKEPRVHAWLVGENQVSGLEDQ